MTDFRKELDEYSSGMDMLFGTPNEKEYLDVEFDFTLDPDHFMKWLGECDELVDDLTGDYKYDCGSMCEYAILYISMLLHDKELEGELEIMYGNVGFWEHYWMRYKFRGESYHIDLTMMQFDPEAPKLAISKAVNNKVSGEYNHIDDDGELMVDYIERQRAYMFYPDPVNLKKPEKKVGHIDFFTTFDV